MKIIYLKTIRQRDWVMSNKAEEKYIRMRKRKAFRNRICFYLCRIFPIKKNLVSVCTFEGKGGFGCNPKYIVQELHKRNSDYKFVWFVNDRSKEFPDYIKKVPNTVWSRAYWLSRSKVWIDNYRKPYGTCKRKGQYYLNVNHYTVGFKCTGLWRGSGFSKMAYLVSKNDSDMIDDLIIDSHWAEVVSPKGMVYEGTYLKTGVPRCDVLYGNREIFKRQFRDKHKISQDAKIVLFAPTFREGAVNGKRSVFSEVWTIDFERLIDTLEKKWGGIWYVCVRVHPQLAETFKEYQNKAIQEHLIDESQADDMYEILAGVDTYITDYSSAAFEAMFAKIPVFIYADDIQKYAKDRGNMMWNLTTDSLDCVTNNKVMTPEIDVVLPCSIATNNDELEQNIVCFDMEKYQQSTDDFAKKIDLVFDGKASARVAEKISGMLS